MQNTIRLKPLFRDKEPYWTYDSIQCYKRGCVCKNCPMADLIGKQCQLKAMVLELVRVIGRPQGVVTKQFLGCINE